MVTRVVVLFDSITNSVFEGQTLQYLINTAHQYAKTIIISFETTLPNKCLIDQIQNSGFQCIIKLKTPFVVQELLLIHSAWLKKFIKKLGIHMFFVRGPHAGYIAINAMSITTQKIMVQARGLCAEEYKFITNKRGLIYQLRYRSLKRLEKYVYSYYHHNYTIEAVSDALRKYLIEEFNAKNDRIIIASLDTPRAIDPAFKDEWRQKIRHELSITDTQEVYCYSGSAKPWQCAEESINYFENILSINNKAHLLILTPDITEFGHLCKKLPDQCYSIKKVPSKHIYTYLAAADYGIILRQPHIVNWISRPTKWLEYKAVGLKIIHNQTVSCLLEDL